MVSKAANILHTGILIFLFTVSAGADSASHRAATGAVVSPPVGWTQFCTDHLADCTSKETIARDIVMTPKLWADIGRVNKYVNDTVKPITDAEHWGTMEKWSLTFRRLQGLQRLCASEKEDVDRRRWAARISPHNRGARPTTRDMPS